MITAMLRYSVTAVAYVADYGMPCRVDMGNVGYISKHVNLTGLRAGIRPENIELGGGEISSPFDTSAGGSNRVEVVVIGDEGCLYVNGSLISCFDVSERTFTEDILISSDFGDVWYSGFRAREALVETE